MCFYIISVVLISEMAGRPVDGFFLFIIGRNKKALSYREGKTTYGATH